VFTPGLQLSRLFYEQAVRPILDRHLPGLRHSAALIGPGSDVHGFDTPQSMDHDWGPRVLLFVPDAERDALAPVIDRVLSDELPVTFNGVPTHFAGKEGGTRWLESVERGPVNHGVKVFGIDAYFDVALGCVPARGWGLSDWLATPGQALREITGGAVFHDALGLEVTRERLRFYEHDVWLYLLATQWQRIGQEAAFAGRAAQMGDALGSRVIAARQARDVMRLAFLLERQYAPYSKWLGLAFGRLTLGAALTPELNAALDSREYAECERHLCAAYFIAARAHNALRVCAPVPEEIVNFHNRPFLVIEADVIAEITLRAVTDPAVRALPRGVGAIDQWVDSTDVLTRPALWRRAASGMLASA
jgi:hypothetical protein